MTVDWLSGAHRGSPWEQLQVAVLGAGVTGFAVADTLTQLGARATVLADERRTADEERVTLLELLDVPVLVPGVGANHQLPAGTDLVVTSPGVRPTHPVLQQAAASGVPVWAEVELAWRLRPGDVPAPWLGVTGTNGKTTTTRMLAAMLRAHGVRVAEVGNIGEPAVTAMMDPAGTDVVALELSSFQLHGVHTMGLHSAAVLNLAPDHLDWHGSAAAYRSAKARIYERVQHSCVYNVADAATEAMVRDADVQEGARAIGFTLGIPSVGMLGIVEDVLVDRAFVAERRTSAAELATVDDVVPAAPHTLANALAAAALARSYGVTPRAVRQGLRSFVPEPHRIATVAETDGVRWVDDSKATNTHAATASLLAYDSVVWIAGGQAKGADFSELVETARDRLRGVVLLGQDRAVLAETLRRHAPDVPVVDAMSAQNDPMGDTRGTAAADPGGTDPGRVMHDVVAAAARMARPGDTVLLAPACASWDMFRSYAARGEAFADAVRARTA